MMRKEILAALADKRTTKREVVKIATKLLGDLEATELLLKRIHEQHGMRVIRVETSVNGASSSPSSSGEPGK